MGEYRDGIRLKNGIISFVCNCGETVEIHDDAHAVNHCSCGLTYHTEIVVKQGSGW